MIRCTVLAYPNLGAEALNCPGDGFVAPEVFAEQMHYLANNGFSVISLSQLCDAFSGLIALPDKAVVLTFGADSEALRNHAVPVLHQLGFQATAYVRQPARNAIDRSQLWRELGARGWTIAHDFGPDAWRFAIPSADPTRLVVDAKDRFEQMLGRPVEHCGYAAGSFGGSGRRVLGALGYRSGSSIAPGPGNWQIGPFMIRRVAVDGRDQVVRFGWKLWRIGSASASPGSLRQAA